MNAINTLRTNNSTNVVGFVATEPQISTFADTSVARFALAIRSRRVDRLTGKVITESSLIPVEKWSRNSNLTSLESLRKGVLVEVRGQLKPNEWVAADGTLRSRIILGARSVREVARPARQSEEVNA